MRKLILVFMLLSLNALGTLLAQTETEHFVYEPAKGGGIRIKPKGEVNPILKKGEAVLELGGYNGNIPWHDDARVKPFQKLIDEGALPPKRMRELEEGKEPMFIIPYFDETGIVQYVYYWLPDGVKTLLTDKELYAICQGLKGVLYDMSHAEVEWSETGSRTIFYCTDFYNIPFEDLRY